MVHDIFWQALGLLVLVHASGCCGCVSAKFKSDHPVRFAAIAFSLASICLGAGAVTLGYFAFGGKVLVVALAVHALSERRSLLRTFYD